MYTQWNRHVPRLAVATSRNLKDWTKHGPAFAKAFDGKFFNLGCKSGSILTEVVKGKQVDVYKRQRMMPTKSGDSNKHISPVPG